MAYLAHYRYQAAGARLDHGSPELDGAIRVRLRVPITARHPSLVPRASCAPPEAQTVCSFFLVRLDRVDTVVTDPLPGPGGGRRTTLLT